MCFSLRHGTVINMVFCFLFLLPDTTIISQSEELGEDFTVMDWINEANKRKRVILYLQLL